MFNERHGRELIDRFAFCNPGFAFHFPTAAIAPLLPAEVRQCVELHLSQSCTLRMILAPFGKPTRPAPADFDAGRTMGMDARQDSLAIDAALDLGSCCNYPR
jgi:hypothetical protein